MPDESPVSDDPALSEIAATEVEPAGERTPTVGVLPTDIYKPTLPAAEQDGVK